MAWHVTWTPNVQAAPKGGPGSREASGLEATKAAKSRNKQARQAYGFLVTLIRELRACGESFQAISDRLNADSHPTSRA